MTVDINKILNVIKYSICVVPLTKGFDYLTECPHCKEACNTITPEPATIQYSISLLSQVLYI